MQDGLPSKTRPLPSPRGFGGWIHPLRAFRRARVGMARGEVDWQRGGWPAATCAEASARSDLRKGASAIEEGREQRAERREKREERGEKREETREKREEIRVKREERRERREERRDNNEDRPEEAARGPQMRPPEGGPTLFYTMLPLVRPHLGTEGRGKRADKREKRQESREKTCLIIVIIHDGLSLIHI